MPWSLVPALTTLLVAGSAGSTCAQEVQEVVFADFDLAGWQRRGVVSIHGAELDLDPLALEVLFDNDAHTAVRTNGLNPAGMVFAFPRAQIVRAVGVRPGLAGTYEIDLIVVEPDGSRFAAGEKTVDGGREAVFGLLDVPVSQLEFTIERIDEEADSVHLAELRVTGQITVTSIDLLEVPETLPEGGSFPVTIVGRDTFGGRPDLTDLARLQVSPTRALVQDSARRVSTRAGGPIRIAPRLGALIGATENLLVIPLAGAPPPPRARAGLRVVHLDLAGAAPYEILRRSSGEKNSVPLGVTHGDTFADDTVEPGQAYLYAARGVDAFGNPRTEVSQETRARTWGFEPVGHVDLGRMPVLVVLFLDSLAPGEADGIVQSLDHARAFLYRHTSGRANLELHVLGLTGPTPVTAGPTMAGIEQRLRDWGVPADGYGLVYAVASDLAGDFAGFTLLGGTAGAMGRMGDVATPPGALGPRPGAAWSFLHELHHAVGLVMAPAAGLPPLASGHFPEDFAAGLLGRRAGRAFDAGSDWDALAKLWSRFEGWGALVAPHRRSCESIDVDGDGLVDDDPRLPFDELRLGTDPTRPDTDGDGLSDLAELAAGLYAGSDPLAVDTDGDGLLDGDDPWPLEATTGEIPSGELAAVAHGNGIELEAAWSPDALRLALTTADADDLFLELDGSGALGRWETDVTVIDARGGFGSDVWCGPAGLALRAHEAPTGVFVGGRAVPGAVLTRETLGDGRVRVIASLPAALGAGAQDVPPAPGGERVTGLRLRPGTVLGLNVLARRSMPDDPAPFEAQRPGNRSLFERHRLIDLTLVSR